MTELHIVVCIKVVPKPEEIQVDPETHFLMRECARSEINPPDMNALEVALRLKDDHGGRISLVSMGPPLFDHYLRIGLAMGADEAYLLSDRDFAGADTLATTYTLAKGIQKLGPVDLIICGEESSDGATGQVPPGLAEWLDLPLITMISRVEIDPERRAALARREYGSGYERIEVPLPAVLSVKTAANEPRFMDYEIKPWAFEQAKVVTWNHEDLGAEEGFIGVPGSPTTVTGLEQASSRERKMMFIAGTAQEMARQLAQLLRDPI